MFDNLTVMKVGLFGAVFVALVLRANCGNDDEMRAKLEVMERHLARMDAMEKRLAKMDAMEERQQAKMDAMEKHLAKMDAMAKCQEVMEKRLVEMDAMEKRQEIIEKREEVTNKRLAAVEQQHGKDSFKPNKSTCQGKANLVSPTFFVVKHSIFH